jgi:hypothetical protein
MQLCLVCANFENYFILHSVRLQLCRLVIYADQPVATKQGKLLFTIKSYVTIACYRWRPSNWKCVAHDRNGSPSAGPFQSSWSWHNIRAWNAVCGAYTHRERYADLFSCRLPAELCTATYSMLFVLKVAHCLVVPLWVYHRPRRADCSSVLC